MPATVSVFLFLFFTAPAVHALQLDLWEENLNTELKGGTLLCAVFKPQ